MQSRWVLTKNNLDKVHDIKYEEDATKGPEKMKEMIYIRLY